MKDKIILIDGHSILYRAYYGIPLLSNSEGLHTNAVYGFLNILFKVLEEENAQYLAVAFDLHAPTFRHKKYAPYKGTRHPMPDELREQVPVIKELLKAMRIPLMMLEGYEADDLIGTVSKRAEEDGLQVSIISGDRDLLQLASDTTLVRIPKAMKGGTIVENYYAKDVVKAYGVTPAQFIEVKALMGDASDNIPGIPFVGQKTATKIIAQYHTIRNAYDHIDEIKPSKVRSSLRDYWDDAVLSEYLATIERNVPFDLNMEDARLDSDHAALYTLEALDICKMLELKKIIAKFSSKIGRDALEQDRRGSFRFIDMSSTAESQIGEMIYAPSSGGRIGLSVVSSGRSLIGAAIATCGETIFLQEVTKEQLRHLIDKSTRIDMIGAKEQLDFLDDGQAFPPNTRAKFFDGSIAAYLLNPLHSLYTYDVISKTYVGRIVMSRDELLDSSFPGSGSGSSREETPKSFPSGMEDVADPLVKIACLEAWTARESEAALYGKLKEAGMDSLFDRIEMPLLFVLYHMQCEGILVKPQELKDFSEELSGGIARLQSSIYQQAGREFNINSPKQLGDVLFNELKLPYGKKTKTGYSTAAEVLNKLAQTFPIVSDILSYRQLTKLKSTYADGLGAYIAPDGRIHGKFNQTSTSTGRISSTDPNLQNIPIRTQLGKQLRKVFVPKEGYCFADADYSQIELRVLAHVSGDENLIRAYNSAQDIHAITASQVFHVPLDQVTPQMRRNAKAVNFGIVYGISSFGLSQDLSITRKEAEKFIEQYFKTFPGIKIYLDDCVKNAKRLGYSTTMFGRRRPVPELFDSNFARRSFGERIAKNAPVQGSAADIIKIAMIGVDRRLREEHLKSRLVLQVHDELLVEAEKSEIDQVEKILRDEMEGAVRMRVRLEVDIHTGSNWYEAH